MGSAHSAASCGRPTLQQQRIADAQSPLGRHGDLVLAAQMQLSRPAARTDAQPPQRDQQVEARIAVKARQGQPLEHPLEAPLGRSTSPHR